MQITIVDEVPVVSRPNRRKHGEVIAALYSTTAWVRVPLAEVTGKSSAVKQSAIQNACKAVGLRVQTRTAGDFLYIRRRQDVVGVL